MCPVGTQSIWGIWKSSTRLADGREIVYFDEEPGLGRDQVADTRPLPPRMPGPQPPHGRPEWGIRWDRLAGEWVVIAAARQDRTFLPPADQCPLDPSAPGRPTEIPADNYDVVVFENRFPSLAEPLGRCEVVCFTPDHDSSFAALSPRRVRTVLEAWVDRTQALGALPETRQVYCFENRGEEIGVTLSHPHGQIYAYPFVPPRMRRQIESAGRYRERTGECLHCVLLAAERRAGTRIVAENDLVTVVVPHAARWPYEAHVYPRRHVPDLPALTDAERAAVARAYLDLLQRFDRLFPTPTPYIAAWMQAPARDDRELMHLHAEVFSIRRAAGKLKYLAGSESGAEVWINDISPEGAAAALRGETR
jgi:UDPglucose--hexose-1-phosphate uridylyltransferase